MVWCVYIQFYLQVQMHICMTDTPGAPLGSLICTQRRELCHADMEGLIQGWQRKERWMESRGLREEGLGTVMWVPMCGQKWKTGSQDNSLTRQQSLKRRGLELQDGRKSEQDLFPWLTNTLARTAVDRTSDSRGVNQPHSHQFTRKRVPKRRLKSSF